MKDCRFKPKSLQCGTKLIVSRCFADIEQNFWSKTSAGLILTRSCHLPWQRNPEFIFNYDYEQPAAWHPNSTKVQLELSYPWQTDHAQHSCKFDLSNSRFLINPEWLVTNLFGFSTCSSLVKGWLQRVRKVVCCKQKYVDGCWLAWVCTNKCFVSFLHWSEWSPRLYHIGSYWASWPTLPLSQLLDAAFKGELCGFKSETLRLRRSAVSLQNITRFNPIHLYSSRNRGHQTHSTTWHTS